MQKLVFRNRPIALGYVAVGVMTGLGIAFIGGENAHYVLGLLVMFCSFAVAWFHYLGVVVEGNDIYFPFPVISILPFLVVGRKHVEVVNITYIKSRGEWFGFEAADIHAPVAWRVLFPNRSMRRAFFEAVVRSRPSVSIYSSRRMG